MTDRWWLTVRSGAQAHCWPVGDTSDESRIQELITRARVLVGVPPGISFDIKLTLGQPHPDVLATAVVHELSDLDSVTPEALAAYRAQSDADQRRTYVQSAREAMLRLTSEERAQVINEIPPRTGGPR